MNLYTIKGALINASAVKSWMNLFQASSELLRPIIDKGNKSKVLLFHYSNAETLPTGELSWTTNFSLNKKDITDSTGLVPYEGYKYVYIALVTLEDKDDIAEISPSVNLTQIGGHEILLNLNEEQRSYIDRFPITMFD